MHVGDTLSLVNQSVLQASTEMSEEQNSLLNDWSVSSFFLILFVIILGIVLLRYNVKRWVIGHLKVLALIIWIAGVGLYCVGFDDGGCRNNVLALYLRASLSAMEMFVSHSDLIEVQEHWHRSGVYMTVFSVVHFCAVLISAIFILRLFGLNLLSRIKLIGWKLEGLFGRKYDLAVFWGINHNALSMARSLCRDKQRKVRILFVNLADDHHHHEASRFTFSHFFHSASAEIEQYADEIEETGGIVLSAGKRLQGLEADCKDSRRIFRLLGLSRFCDMLACATLESGAQVDFYFLSDQEQDNLSFVMALKRVAGQDAHSPYEQNQKFSCYCHARKNSVNFALINSEGLRYQVHFIDSSSLSVWQLKKNAACQPVNFVEVDTDKGVVTTPFTAMVIGFGETGRDAFGFLYEYGSFVADVQQGHDGDDHVVEQQKKIYVVDRNLDVLKSEFLSDRPGLKNDPRVEWYGGEALNQEALSDRITHLINGLSYVIVTVGDDEEAISIATKICHIAYRYRETGSRLGLFVRIRHKEQQKKMRIVKTYFDRYNTQSNIFIDMFGCEDEIFSYDTLRHDVLEAHAKLFFYQYAKASAELSWSGEDLLAEQKRLAQSGPDEEWCERRRHSGSTIRDHIDLYYKEEQDRSNACHVLTKRILAGLKDGDEATRRKCLSDDRLIRTLGYVEHLRWNAKMYLMGFEYAPVKKIEKKQHPCLTDCDRLIRNASSKGTLRYDEAVVKLSLSKDFDHINCK